MRRSPLLAPLPALVLPLVLPVSCAILISVATGCARSPAGAGEETRPSDATAADATTPVLHAVASLPPLGWLVRQVGGPRVAVDVLLPPGTSPHAFEPTPRQLAAFAAADLFVAVGDPDLAFEHRQVEHLLRERPELPVVRLAADGPTGHAAPRVAPTGAGDPGHDPHLWLDPHRMALAAASLAATLTRLDPAGNAVYGDRLAALEADLAALDQRFSTLSATAPRRRFFVQHPAWGHLAAAYGLQQVALEEEGKEPSPRLLVRRIDEARAEGATTLFVERGSSQRAARAFAAETGAEIVVLDPLAADWWAEMEHTADALERALGAAPARRPAATETGP